MTCIKVTLCDYWFYRLQPDLLDKKSECVNRPNFTISSVWESMMPTCSTLLHRYMVGRGCTMQMPFFLISAALLMQVSLCYWVRRFLTPWQAGCSLSIRAGVLSDVVVSGASRGNVLLPFLFTSYTTDCLSNSEPRHLQKFPDDSAFVTCLGEGEEGGYSTLVDNFVEWTEQNHPRLNVG